MDGMIEQEWINDKLRDIGTELIKEEYEDTWCEVNPTRGYCYILSEALFHYVFLNSEPYYIKLSPDETHWFLKNYDGKVIDYTANQYGFEIPYQEATKGSFYEGSVKTPRGKISQRGYKLAKRLGFIKDED